MDIIPMYKEEMLRIMKKQYPQLNNFELRKAIDYSVNKRYKEEYCDIDNNYTHTKVYNMTLEAITNWINEREPICTAYGVMFKKHGKTEHPLIGLIRTFMEGRDKDKALMFKYLDAHDYENAAKYKMFQILDKRDANSIYGCMGNSSSVLYNLYVAASITMQGRSVISTATMFFEGFLANNVHFGSLEEVLHFIDNVCLEKPTRRFSDNNILDFNVSADMVFAKVMKTCIDWRKGKIRWVPDYTDAKIIHDTIKSLSQEDLNRVFYKNNLYAFTENTVIMNGIKYILKSLKEPYLTPNHVPEEIKVELDALQDLYREYVYYPHMYIDRIDRCNNMIKDVCVISDTDSTIVSFDAFYHFVLDRVMGEDIDITALETDLTEYINSESYNSKVVPKKELRYDFYNDEVIEKESMVKPFVIIPQNNLRFSIINIIAYISGNLCNEYVELYTKCNHSYSPDKKCLLYLKNEFLFSRALLTMNKKNYATNQELQEGVIIEQVQDRALDLKGLAINKSTTNSATKKELKKILYEDILTADKIDQVRIIEKILIFVKQIEESLRSGDKSYYKPTVIKAISNYADPLRIQGIKAALIWNAVHDDGLESIDLNARNSIELVKVNITSSNITQIQDTYPEIYDKFIDLFETDNLKLGPKPEIDTLAIPVDVKTPDWVKIFIDYNTIINDNIGNFPYESVGITRLGSNSVTYSNIMKL